MKESVETILRELLESLGFSGTPVSHEVIAGQTVFTIGATGDDARTLIGPHGDAIHALDHLVKKILERRSATGESEGGEERSPLFLVDVDGYRARQIRDLQAKAVMMAERARSFQYDVELSPMSAYERLIVHTTLQDAPNVRTESQGEGRSRRVVIKYQA
jgi:spoIIIJ-associated protein